MREGRKRLSVDIPIEMFAIIKENAKKRNITITKWILRACFARIKLEGKD